MNLSLKKYNIFRTDITYQFGPLSLILNNFSIESDCFLPLYPLSDEREGMFLKDFLASDFKKAFEGQKYGEHLRRQCNGYLGNKPPSLISASLQEAPP